MAQTWAGWQAAVLKDIPAPASAANVRFLTEWHGFELSGAQFNPLNTTQREPGSTSFNSVGVQNYRTHAQGALATATTLKNGFYPNIVTALKQGDPYAYVDAPAVGQEITRWGTPRFAAKYLAETSPNQPGTTFTPTDGPNVPHMHHGWADLRNSMNKHLPRQLEKSATATRIAYGTLAHRHAKGH